MIEKKWYAVYTKVRWEKKVAEVLTKHDIENYCPLNKVSRQWADRKKLVSEPLFTSYVFVRTNEFDHFHVKKVSGVLNFVYWLGKPAVIRDQEIEMIQHFLNQHGTVNLEKSSVNINDKVRIVSGPLINQEGHVVAINSNTVKLILPSLGFTLSAHVDKSQVQKIEDSTKTLLISGSPTY